MNIIKQIPHKEFSGDSWRSEIWPLNLEQAKLDGRHSRSSSSTDAGILVSWFPGPVVAFLLASFE